MIKDTAISKIYDFADANRCFSGVHIDGGICYFLWDKSHDTTLDYYYTDSSGELTHSNRFLYNEKLDSVIRDIKQESIIKKVIDSEEKFSSIVLSRNPYGFNADLFNRKDKYKSLEMSEDEFEDSCRVYGVEGIKGGSKRTVGYVPISIIKKNKAGLNSYKLFFSKAYMITATVPPEIIKASPNEICTETFLQIGEFQSELERDNCLTYIKTKFFRALLFFNRSSLNISTKSFDLIPLLGFQKKWTDEELYNKYNLTSEEIEYIEQLVSPMP
jgi:hypothetical protein